VTRGLVFREGSLTQIEEALSDATTNIKDHLTGILDTVNAQTSAWTDETPSRQAQRDYERRLRDGVTSLTEALDTVRTAVAEHRERARDAEVENVAVIG
jgi:outer membrane protein TolC